MIHTKISRIIVPLILLVICSQISFSQKRNTPIEENNFSKLTINDELNSFLKKAVLSNKKIFKLDTLGFSETGKAIPYIKIAGLSKRVKLKILLFAQQHGNEPSGKEALLLLVKKFSENNYRDLLNKTEIIIVPQVNPDGGDNNKRVNAGGFDLNRDHLLIRTKEVEALHKLYNSYLPHVTLDIHEYSPYSESWKKYGYLKYFDVMTGTLTNPNCDAELISLQKNEVLPFIKKRMEQKGFTFNEYIVGGPPDRERLRFSTYDINDGRQSMGIQGSLSFIQEGKSGENSLDNIKQRTLSQLTAVEAFLDFCYKNAERIISIVQKVQKKIKDNTDKRNFSLRMEHIADGQNKELEFFSLSDKKFQKVNLKNFHTADSIILSVNPPAGYLINKIDTVLINFCRRHEMRLENGIPFNNYIIEKDRIIRRDSAIIEEETTIIPEIIRESIFPDGYNEIKIKDYFYVPLSQIKRNTIISAFESCSMFALCQNNAFRYLIKDKVYPILRVIKQSK